MRTTKPLTIKLLNMPFSAANVPSIALTQLASVVARALGDRVVVDVLYPNQDFMVFLRAGGILETGDFAFESQFNGIGDWFFRQAAFPELEDNAERYFGRYYPRTDARTQAFRRGVVDRRAQLDRFFDELIEREGLVEADVLGFTTMFSQTAASIALARKLKEIRPEIVTAMGGANCEPPMGEAIFRHVEHLDFVFLGPALVSFPAVLRCLLEGDHEAIASMRGVLSRSVPPGPGSTQLGEELDIDEAVPLDYTSFLASYERLFPGAERPPIFFETSRGCWWGERAHCTFCGLNGSSMKYRAMRPDLAVRQFESLFARYGDRASCFFGVDAIMPRSYVEDVLPHVRAPVAAPIFYEVKADLKEPELEILVRSGARRIQPGIESFATSSLKLMRKGNTAFHNVVLLKNCRRLGIEVIWNLLLGLPGEDASTFEKYAEDLPRLVHLEPPTGAHTIRFDRYSPYFVQAETYGLDLRPYEFYRFTYPFPDEALAQMAYFFVDHNYQAPHYTALARWLRPIRAIVDDWRRRWQAPGAAGPPRLEYRRKADRVIVEDARDGALIEHDLGPSAIRVLRALDRPRREADVPALLEGHVDEGPALLLSHLRECGLLFEERGRMLSLVMPGDLAPLPATTADRDEIDDDDDDNAPAPPLVTVTTFGSARTR